MKAIDYSYEKSLQRFLAKLFCKNEMIHNNGLTRREEACLILLLMGDTAKMTAKKLNISHRTVEKHLDNIKHKLGVKRKIEIINKITSFGLSKAMNEVC